MTWGSYCPKSQVSTQVSPYACGSRVRAPNGMVKIGVQGQRPPPPMVWSKLLSRVSAPLPPLPMVVAEIATELNTAMRNGHSCNREPISQEGRGELQASCAAADSGVSACIAELTDSLAIFSHVCRKASSLTQPTGRFPNSVDRSVSQLSRQDSSTANQLRHLTYYYTNY